MEQQTSEKESWIVKVPWTTLIGIVLGLITTWIVYDGITRMSIYERDYNGFIRDFLSISLVIESLVFGMYIAYTPKKKYNIWNDSVMVYWISIIAIPFSIFFTVWGLVEAWMDYGSVIGIRFLTSLTTLIAYSSIYATTIKIARKAVMETEDW